MQYEKAAATIWRSQCCKIAGKVGQMKMIGPGRMFLAGAAEFRQKDL